MTTRQSPTQKCTMAREAHVVHIDTDEANAANVQTGAQGFIEGNSSAA